MNKKIKEPGDRIEEKDPFTEITGILSRLSDTIMELKETVLRQKYELDANQSRRSVILEKQFFAINEYNSQINTLELEIKEIKQNKKVLQNQICEAINNL
jgi:septal ring factor EnvC (AmiA/AmiB activator)